MTEGTKLGEFKDDMQFKTSVTTNPGEISNELTATRIGQVSDFEKSLYPAGEEAVQAPPQVSAAPVFTQPEAPARVQTPVAAEVEEDEIAEDNWDDSELFAKQFEETVVNYEEGDIIKGVIRKIENSGLIIDIHFKSDGFVPNAEISNSEDITTDNFTVGQEVDVFIVKLETKEGYTMLSRKRAEYELGWNYIGQIAKSKELIEVRAVSKVQGGLVAEYRGIRGFVPASHVLKTSNEALDDFIGSAMPVIVLQADRKRRKVVFSAKLAKARPQKEPVTKLIETIEIGEVRHGVVSSIKDFGAFVDIGGVEGLVHISEMSWARVNHPSEIVKIGDKVDVFVLGADKETNKVSLGMKQLQPDPWVNVAERYTIGQVVSGTVTRVASFGAFIQIEKDLEGLIHISELSYSHIDKVEDIVKVGEKITAKIIKLIPDEQRIGLTLKGMNPNPDEVKAEKAETADVENTPVEEAEPQIA